MSSLYRMRRRTDALEPGECCGCRKVGTWRLKVETMTNPEQGTGQVSSRAGTRQGQQVQGSPNAKRGRQADCSSSADRLFV